ncbi:MAG: hypothetical protein EBU08_13835 [Micrococcales bacterium]|jgi:hypothetical protein|nr:hypothetical protein [Micrococcales bacterium]
MKSPIEVLNDPNTLESLARVQYQIFKTNIQTLKDVGAFSDEDPKIMLTYMGDFDSLSYKEQEHYRDQAWKVIQTVVVSFLANSMTPDQYGG